jgi:broad specificity phosphatase PhoE
MRRLIFVRHSLPEINPSLPAREWHLSEAGRQLCQPLAKELLAFAPDAVVTSVEPKAIETGQLVAQILNQPFAVVPGLHEHERDKGVFTTRARFETQVARLFAEPGKLVFGNETADEAHTRFAQAVSKVLKRYSGQNLVVVTHGTVLTLYVSRVIGLDPYPFWKRLGLPAFVVVSLPDFGLVTIVEDIVAEP